MEVGLGSLEKREMGANMNEFEFGLKDIQIARDRSYK
jgi:hypothetical protein